MSKASFSGTVIAPDSQMTLVLQHVFSNVTHGLKGPKAMTRLFFGCYRDTLGITVQRDF